MNQRRGNATSAVCVGIGKRCSRIQNTTQWPSGGFVNARLPGRIREAGVKSSGDGRRCGGHSVAAALAPASAGQSREFSLGVGTSFGDRRRCQRGEMGTEVPIRYGRPSSTSGAVSRYRHRFCITRPTKSPGKPSISPICHFRRFAWCPSSSSDASWLPRSTISPSSRTSSATRCPLTLSQRASYLTLRIVWHSGDGRVRPKRSSS